MTATPVNIHASGAAIDAQVLRQADALNFLRHLPVSIIDGNAYTSRPGPRVVDGAERIQAALAGRAARGLEQWLRAR